MGVIINAAMLNADFLKKTSTPIIICSNTNRAVRLIEDGQYVPLNINVMLAEALVKYPEPQRTSRANEEIMSILSKCQTPIVFEDFEILFDPRYDIDAIKVFIEASKRQKIVVKWCGQINGEFLEYATLAHNDYHSFRIKDYDISCVV